MDWARPFRGRVPKDWQAKKPPSNCEVLERLVIELELPLKRAIGHTTSLAQERDHLIHHRDKVHPVSFLPGARPPYACATPS
jgi:hypothetical protein